MTWLLPIKHSYLAQFLAYLYSKNLRYSTILGYTSAISFYHKVSGFRDPMDSFYITKIVQGIKRQSVPPNQLAPISRNILQDILQVLPSVAKEVYDYKLYSAIFLLMYYGCLRVGEAVVISGENRGHTLQVDQVLPHRSVCGGSIEAFDIKFTSYKHSGGKTPTVRIPMVLTFKACRVSYGAILIYSTIRTWATFHQK
jgi:hypothetical protein